MKEWGLADKVEFLHQWGSIADGALTAIPEDVQAVLVVKDASDPATLRTLNVLYSQGFRYSRHISEPWRKAMIFWKK